MQKIYSTKNLFALVITLTIFASVAFYVLPVVTSTVATAEACCGSDPVYPPNPGGDNDGDSSTPVPLPACDITSNLAAVVAGSDYTITWNVVSAAPVNVYINGTHVTKTGSEIYTFNVAYLKETFTLTATNAGGTCFDEVIVTKKPSNLTPTCDITANVSTVVAGGTFRITWNGTPTDAIFKVNGTAVIASDSATYTFPANRTTATFTFTGNNQGVTCSDSVVVTKRVTPVTPTCDITADVTAVLPGGTFRITWNGTPTDAIFKVNGTAVIASDSATYTFPANQNTATFTFTGDNNGLTCSDTVVVNKINPGNPVCTLTAAPTQVTVGGLSKLTWTATNAVGTATINQGVGSVNPNNSAGFRNVTPPTTTTYTMTVQNSAGVTASCTATVSVVPVEPLPPTCDLFTAQPTSIVRGDNSTLTWTTSNASSVVINNGVGSGTVDGTVTVSPLDTTTYTLTATGGNSQTVSCAVTVVVTNPPVDTVPVCNSFTASVTSLPAGGGNTTLTWATSRATTVSINPLLGSVSVDGSQVVAITATTDFVLTATDADGDTKTCAVKVLVAPVDTSITCAANVNFTASPSSIDEGDNATLSWNTTGITSLSINNGVSATALDGSTVVSPNSDTTYTMTATDGNDTIYCPVTISVDEDNGGGGGGSPTPRCDLEISDSSINLGDRVTLTWETSNATEVTIKDNFGKTLITTEDRLSNDKDELYDGEITIRPEKDTTYTLLAERSSRDDECEVNVDVADTVIVTQVRDQQPLVSGIALTQVPYTGFAAGPFLTILFYTLLAAWALYLAYIFVIGRNPSAHGLATASAVPLKPAVTQNIDARELFVASTVASPVFHQPVVAPTQESTQVVGYATQVMDETTAMIENQAHAAHVLLSSDAMRYFVTATVGVADRTGLLETVLTEAKASYPTEDGWVVLSEERMQSLTATKVTSVSASSNAAPFTPTLTPTGSSSLAEAIVSGNIVAAYQMIGNRPMIALADAAADLDALYRVKQGGAAKVSDLLLSLSDTLATDKLHTAIAALTGALDGVYTDEASAVKMAIMKATKAVNG